MFAFQIAKGDTRKIKYEVKDASSGECIDLSNVVFRIYDSSKQLLYTYTEIDNPDIVIHADIGIYYIVIDTSEMNEGQYILEFGGEYNNYDYLQRDYLFVKFIV